MGVAATLLSRALGLTALGIVMLTAMAGADPAADSRLIFDPGALDRGQLGSDRDPAQRAGARPAKSPAQASEQIWIPNTFNLPDFGDRSLVGRGLAQGLSSPHNQVAPAEANLFEQRATPGGVSIGLETETTIKQRSSAAKCSPPNWICISPQAINCWLDSSASPGFPGQPVILLRSKTPTRFSAVHRPVGQIQPAIGRSGLSDFPWFRRGNSTSPRCLMPKRTGLAACGRLQPVPSSRPAYEKIAVGSQISSAGVGSRSLEHAHAARGDSEI